MDNQITAKSIVGLWPSKRDLAADVTRITGKELKPIAVFRWASRNSIPAKYDGALVRAAAERNKRLSLVDLMDARSNHIDQAGNPDGEPQGQKVNKAADCDLTGAA